MVVVETTRGRRPVATSRHRQPNAAFNISPFMRLARTHAASTAGDAMVAASLAGTIFFGAATSEARGQTFLYLLLTMAPFAVVAPLIGPALDRARSGRRWIVIGSAVVRALLCLVLIGRTDSLLLYPVAFAILVIQKGYGIARSSLVPAVVMSDAELVEANSKLQLLSGLMGFVGAAPAALLFKLFDDSPSPALFLALCTFAATAALAVRIPKVAVAPTTATPEEKAELRSVGVLLAAGSMGLLRGIVGFLTLYFAFHFRAEDQLAAFGFVAAVSVGGTLLGSVMAPKLREVWPEERMLISVLVMTVATGVLALALGGVLGAAVIGGAVGIASTAGKLAFDSIVQRDAPDANRGRLFAKFETRFQLIWVVGAMLGLIPLSQLRLSYLAVALVSGFAAFSYVVGLTAWRHRTGAARSQFGRQAVMIDQAMTQAQDTARRRVRTSTRAVVTRMRSRRPGAEGAMAGPSPVDSDLTHIAGPGIGTAVSVAAVTVGAASATHRSTFADPAAVDPLTIAADIGGDPPARSGSAPPLAPGPSAASPSAPSPEAGPRREATSAEQAPSPPTSSSPTQFVPRPPPPPPPSVRGAPLDSDEVPTVWADADEPADEPTQRLPK